MKCMYCNGTDSRVVDSRPTEEGNAIRRRRECEKCGRRFTTYEKVEAVPLLVIKKDGNREAFDSEKIRRSIIKSIEKRSVSMTEVDRLVREIEMQAYNALDQEITSTNIGEMVMEGLRKIDEVSYVRFASVYRQFRDISTFMSELSKILDEKTRTDLDKDRKKDKEKEKNEETGREMDKEADQKLIKRIP